MDQAGRLLHSPEAALNLIGGNNVSNAEGYQLPNSMNGKNFILCIYDSV